MYKRQVFPPVNAVVDAVVTRGVKNRVVGLLGSHTWAQQALKEMQTKLASIGVEPCVAPVSVKQAPDAKAFDEIAATAVAVASALGN